MSVAGFSMLAALSSEPVQDAIAEGKRREQLRFVLIAALGVLVFLFLRKGRG